MDTIEMNELEIASSEVVIQAAHDFAAALAATTQFQTFEAAAEKMEHDQAAQAALAAFQSKQQEIRRMQSLGTVTADEIEAFNQIRQAFLNQPAVAAYFAAQSNLVILCQAAGDILSNSTGLNFGASAKSSGCC